MDAITINEYLKKTWGKNPHEEPLVRLVWSDDARELRQGTFNIFYGSIFVRTELGVRSVLKYSWIKERWILERWFPPEVTLNPELPESRKGSYEPIYVFQDARGESLLLNLKVVELICSAMFNRPPTKGQIRDQLRDQLETKDKQETAYLEDALEMSVISNQLHQKEAIVIPNKEFQRD
jgi:hypothetical protein